MKLIGRWWGEHRDYELYAPPQELVGRWSPDQKRAVLSHIYFDVDNVDSESSLLHLRLSMHRCEFGCGENWPRTSMHVSDGEWVWPVHLAHYVQYHNVMLPDEFIQQVPGSTQKPWLAAYGDESRADHSDWMDWCRNNRSWSERKKIKARRKAEEVRQKKEIKRRIKQLERASGVSNTACLYRGCASKALNGVAFCAKCLVEKH